MKQQLDILNEPDVNPFDLPYDVYEAAPQFLTVDEDSEEDIDTEVQKAHVTLISFVVSLIILEEKS